MTTAELRKRVQQQVADLSPRELRAADAFVAFLREREGSDATAELLAIPGFANAFDKGMKESRQGKMTPVEDLKRKHRRV